MSSAVPAGVEEEMTEDTTVDISHGPLSQLGEATNLASLSPLTLVTQIGQSRERPGDHAEAKQRKHFTLVCKRPAAAWDIRRHWGKKGTLSTS
jgi:hypothetical protein